MFWANIDPTTQNPPLVRSCRANVGPTTVLQPLNQCSVNVSTPTMTCYQQHQPLPNVGSTIAFYMGYQLLMNRVLIS